MLKFTKRRGFVLLGVIAAVVVAGAAIAYWTAGGSGTSSAATASGAGSLTVSQTSSITPMFPGDTPQTLTGDFINPTGADVYVTQVAVSVTSVTGGDGSCTTDDYKIVGSPMSVNARVPAGATPTTHTGAWTGATIQFNDKDIPQNGCKGATAHLTYTAS